MHCGPYHQCGHPVRIVLDGEEWCDNCRRYRRPAAHGWPQTYGDLSPCPRGGEKHVQEGMPEVWG